ncbi:MAG: CDP-glycerol glycerophosphotransferase family protein [Desulfarculales bacterium]|jgi:CDP-glycerol glycerophosphotransferase (TagB/SpsB family)/glycosyltransferase involved in cell wall biosynthesis|nr:CDP-glycerol glycerophosphotransferase family protein [Desulfarculales bacterium]
MDSSKIEEAAVLLKAIEDELRRPPELYSEEELRRLGIEPDLFLFISRPDFSDNSHALWKYINQNTAYKTAWLIKNRAACELLKERNIACELFDSAAGVALAQKARYVISNIYFWGLHKYPGQIYINLWHGSGIKAHYFYDRNNDNQPYYEAKRDSELTDLYLVQGVLDKFILAALLNCDARKMLVTGQPRIDNIKEAAGKDNLECIFENITRKYDRLILFAPTFRRTTYSVVGKYYQDNILGLPDFNSSSFNEIMAKHKAALVVKLHPIEETNFISIDLEGDENIFLLKNLDMLKAGLQMNDLINAFDVMISDYSSIAYDFLLLDRPIIYNIPDQEEYAQKQGFVFPHIDFWMPGEKVFNFGGLLDALEDAFKHPQRYSAQRHTNIDLRYSYQDNGAARRVLAAIENYRPIINYGQRYFIKEKLLPLAREYEAEIARLKSRLAAPNSTSANEIPPQDEDKELEQALAALLAAALAHNGDTVLLAPLPSVYDGKTKSRLVHIIEQFSKKGWFCLCEVINMPSGCNFQHLNSDLYLTKLGDDIERLFKALGQAGKKIILALDYSLFSLSPERLKQMCAKAHTVFYFMEAEIRYSHAIEKQSPAEKYRLAFFAYCQENDSIHIIVSAQRLYDYFMKIRGKNRLHLITSGVDNSFFREHCAAGTVPDTLKAVINRSKPIIGFCGTITNDLYISLMQYLCERCREYDFVLIGENKLSQERIQVTTVLNSYENLFFAPEISYEDVPAAINLFDVAILPYYSLAKERFPLKFFEYLACAKPVVASDLEYLEEYYPFALTSRSHGEFAQHLQKALRFKKDITFAGQAQEIAAQNDWSLRVNELIEIIGQP